jgi:hypothetical protein
MQCAHGSVHTPHWSSVLALFNLANMFRIEGSKMIEQPALPIWRSSPTRVVVLILHPPELAAMARDLVSAWQPAIPAADLFAVGVAEGGRIDLPNLTNGPLDRTDRRKRPLILAGICGAEAAALQLAFDRSLPQCTGVLIGGRVLPPLGPLATRMADRAVRLRLLWQVDDPTAWAAPMGELLSWFRAAGLDAQGAVLEPSFQQPEGLTGMRAGSESPIMEECAVGSSPSPALVRMGRIYLAELVALAMDMQPRPALSQPFRPEQQIGTDSKRSRSAGDGIRAARVPLKLWDQQ